MLKCNAATLTVVVYIVRVMQGTRQVVGVYTLFFSTCLWCFMNAPALRDFVTVMSINVFPLCFVLD